MQYDKPALTIAAQVARLKQRGLVFTDDARVAHYLTHIGYYRLSAYWLPFELPAPAGAPRSHAFQPGTTFEQVLSLYIFDRQLRLLVMEAMERIETAIRTHWAHALAKRYGPHAHMASGLFKSPWQHASDIARMASDLQDSSETFIAHHGRLWNRRFTLQLPRIKRLKGLMVMQADDPAQPARQLYNYVLLMSQMMLRINPGSSWRQRLKQHIQNIDCDKQRAMGFPDGWAQLEVWQEAR